MVGGKNDFLGIAYVVIGGLCIILGVIFAVAHLIKPRYVKSAFNLMPKRYPNRCISENWVTILISHGTTMFPPLQPPLAVTVVSNVCHKEAGRVRLRAGIFTCKELRIFELWCLRRHLGLKPIGSEVGRSNSQDPTDYLLYLFASACLNCRPDSLIKITDARLRTDGCEIDVSGQGAAG